MSDDPQFFNLTLNQLFQNAHECQIRVIGTINTIFKHRKYIIDVYIAKRLVIRTFKRYNQFQALHEVIKMTFKNIDLEVGEFPSKFQIIGKEETRRDYFQKIMNAIIANYCQKMTNDTNRRLLSTLYIFLSDENKRKALNQSNISQGSDEDNLSEISRRKASFDSTDLEKMEAIKKEAVAQQKDMEKPKSNSFDLSKHLPSVDLQNKLEKKKIGQEVVQVEDQYTILRRFMKTEFLLKFQNQEEWKERYLKIDNSCLLIYRHKNDNNFKTKIELYRMKVQYFHRQKNLLDHFCQKMQFNNSPTFKQNTSIITLSHEYDFQKMLIKKKQENVVGEISLQKAKQIISAASKISTIRQTFQGVFNPIGKFLIVFHKLRLNWSKGKYPSSAFIRIKTPCFIYQTKKMLFSTEVLQIKQAFLIPFSSTFENIIIQVIIVQSDRILSQGQDQKCIGKYKIAVVDYLSYPNGQGRQKMNVQPQIPQKMFTNQYQTVIEMTVQNQSHFSSIYSDSFANQNDGVMLSGLKSTSDTDQLVMTVDRVLRVLGNIALFIQAFWRNVYHFKYYRMGYTFFSFMVLLFAFGNAQIFFELILFIIVFSVAYRIPGIHPFINYFFDKYFFSYIHESFKLPEVMSKSEIKFLNWSNQLIQIKEEYQMNILGKYEKKKQLQEKKYKIFTTEKHGRKFTMKEDVPSLLEKVFQVKKIVEMVLRMINTAVNTIEKICNIVCWADPRRTIVIFLVLVLISSVASAYILRAIGFLFCVHRLYKGKVFYRVKHYRFNRKLTVYSLRYIINKSFASLVLGKDKKKLDTLDQLEIEKAFQDLVFPIHEEDKAKKLKAEIQQLFGVFIDPEALGEKAQKKNSLRIITLVNMIQTCESRLKLEWISGKEGISNEFQQLKQITKQELAMDDWVESLLINFVLNVPSQLFTSHRAVRPVNPIQPIPYEKQIEPKKQFTRIHL